MQVENYSVTRIRINQRAREDLGDIEGLAEDLKKNGLIQPISIDRFGQLLAGHRRLAAAKLAGWTEIPVIVHEAPTKLTSKSIELRENIFRKDFAWPERARLEKEIFELELDADPKWSTRKQAEMRDEGKSQINRRMQLAEAIELIPELAEYETEDQAWKEYKRLEEEVVIHELQKRAPAAVSEASQWADDNYRVGDAFAGMASCRDNSVHFAEVDPPYGVDLDRRKGDRNKSNERISEYNEIDADEYLGFFRKAATDVHRILMANSFAVFWFGQTWWAETRDILREVGFGVPDIAAVWNKGPVGQTASPDTTLGSCYETFWLARKGKPKLAVPGHDNVFNFNKLPPARKIHATEKPIELLSEILRTVLFPGSTILCPFLGSGVTLRAAYSLGHVGFGWDLSERNKELFMRRVRGEVVLTEEEAA